MNGDRFKNCWVHYGFLAVIYGIGLATLGLHTVGHALGQKPKTVSCVQTGVELSVTVLAHQISPSTINGKLCDRVILTNTDTRPHLLALGQHQHHDQYTGFKEQLLLPGGTLILTLGQRGRYTLHDHLNGQVSAQLVVK